MRCESKMVGASPGTTPMRGPYLAMRPAPRARRNDAGEQLPLASSQPQHAHRGLRSPSHVRSALSLYFTLCPACRHTAQRHVAWGRR